MKTSITFLIACLFCFALNSSAQNLVPNPSFEIVNRMPNKMGNSIARAKDWIPPLAASDYYVAGAGRHAGTPRNVFGKQKPRTGIAYAGICNRRKLFEYLEAPLVAPLVNDKEYLVEFYISKAERSLGAIKEFGVFFTDQKIWGRTTGYLSNKPQITFTERKGFRNKKEWIKLSAVYTAEGDETILIFGHFIYDTSAKKRRIRCHYYVDDVSITPIIPEIPAVVTIEDMDSISNIYAPKIGEAVALKNIVFKTNKSELLTESYRELDKLARFLNETINTTILISGHTDNTGNEEQNIALSEARAQSVADYLASKGISKSRINYMGFGSSNPVATNDTHEGKRQNRRVEFFINKI
jgi:OOP family OmpA-OmpF porin